MNRVPQEDHRIRGSFASQSFKKENPSASVLLKNKPSPVLVRVWCSCKPGSALSQCGLWPLAGPFRVRLQAEAPAIGRVFPLQTRDRLLQSLPLLLLPPLQDLLLLPANLLLLSGHVCSELVRLLQLLQLLCTRAVLRQALLLLLQLLLNLQRRNTQQRKIKDRLWDAATETSA